MKIENLEFTWDKNEQLFSEQEYVLRDKSIKRDVEDYFEFLSNFDFVNKLYIKERIADKKFSLY